MQTDLPDRGVRAPAPVSAVLPKPLLITSFDRQRVSRTGIAVTALLHLLVIVIAMLQLDQKEGGAAPRRATDITYIAVRQPQPDTPARPVVKPQPKPAPRPAKPAPRQERVEMARLPDTISPPDEPRREREPPAPPTPAEIPKLEAGADMAEMIAARRRQRQRDSGVVEQETEAQRGERRALANIAAANSAGKSSESGVLKTTFTETIHSPFTATLDFRGYNPERKRLGLRRMEVELGNEPDIQTALVKQAIRFIREEAQGMNFTYDSRRQGRIVTLSPRPEDNAMLETFLFREMFPNHPRGR